MREKARRETPGVVAVLALALLTCAPASAAIEPQALSLQVELLEQAACLTGPDEYRVSFELRTIYLNAGRSPVAIGLAGERIVGASFVSSGDEATMGAGRVAFAVPRGLDDAPSAAPARIAIAEPGWAVTGHATVWLPLSTSARPPADELTPGPYTARFDLRVQARAIDHDGGEPQAFSDIRVSTPELTAFLSDPRQVQECGSFSLPLPSVSSE